MKDATRPVRGRGTKLSAVALAAALVACLAFASMASAVSDPVATGSTTTVTLNKGLLNKLKKIGVKVQQVSPATVKSGVATLPIVSGSLDPTTGQGTLTHEGGIKFKKGKKSVALNALVVETATSTLSGKIGSKTFPKIATISGVTFTRNGFGVNVAIGSMKLIGKAATELNKKLGFTGNKKKNKRATVSKKKKKKKKKTQPPFKGNQVLGSASSVTQPKTVAVLAQGDASLATNEATVKKFVQPPGTTDPAVSGDGVKIEPIAPSVIVPQANPFTPLLKFPITGGTIGPSATAGVTQTGGGVNLVQDLTATPGEVRTTITLANLWVDLGTNKATAEVVVSSNVDPKLNLGSLGRTSIADLSMVGATITSDPVARTVTVQNATATLQATTAEVLNQVFGAPYDAKKFPHPLFAAGDPLGTFTFTAQTQ